MNVNFTFLKQIYFFKSIKHTNHENIVHNNKFDNKYTFVFVEYQNYILFI